ncbi:hypothetical protein ACA910_021975 [Epithemia clementina (nom. ined.)]
MILTAMHLPCWQFFCVLLIVLIEYGYPFFVAGPVRLTYGFTLASSASPRPKSGARLDAATDGSGDLNAMRRMLEASWNIDVMGDVPKDSSAAAQAAGNALRQAMRDNHDTAKPGAYFVDLQFPPYDSSQGTNMYDEVAAVEFCMELAQRIATSVEEIATSPISLILVRDDKAKRTVERVLLAREEKRLKEASSNSQEENTDKDDVEDDDNGEEEDDDDDFGSLNELNEERSVEFYDDFGNFGDFKSETGSASSSLKSDDVDAFRQKLMSNWDKTTESTSISKRSVQSSVGRNEKSSKPSRPNKASDSVASLTPAFRLASLFGSSTISQGADMGGDVVTALSESAQPWANEDTIIVLSASQRDELIAVRSILRSANVAALYDEDPKQRNIILVNCNFDIMPRELSGAKTVYSILPLVAKPAAQSGTNLFQEKPNEEQKNQSPIKVVVMRQYPKDWEVFVDDGSRGLFELAASAPPGAQFGSKVPLMQWVSTCIRNFLQSRLR